MFAYISFPGTTRRAAAITCASRGFPPASWRTFGCLDFRRVPLPAAMMAIAVRGCAAAGELGLFDLGIRLNIPRGGGGGECVRGFSLGPSPSLGADFRRVAQRLIAGIGSSYNQLQQIVSNPVGGVAGDAGLLQVATHHRAYAQCFDRVQVGNDLVSSLKRILGFQIG